MKRAGIAILAMVTVTAAFAQKPSSSASTMPGCVIMDGPQSRPCSPEDWDGKVWDRYPSWKAQWRFLDDSIVLDNVTIYSNSESVNDPIPADAVAPRYREQEPYCPTKEYRIRWFVVNGFEGKEFEAHCVPVKSHED